MCGYDRVLVEPSGIFEVDEFFVRFGREPLDQWYEIGSVIAVVDADWNRNFPEMRNICWHQKWQMQAV